MNKQISPKSVSGFTFIEVMIVVVIVAILASIAVPAYQEQVLRGVRSEGKAYLLDLASRQERFYTQYSSYSTTVSGNGACPGVNCSLGLANNTSTNGNYTVAINATPAGCGAGQDPPNPCTFFTLTATPNRADGKCLTITLDSTGTQGSTGSVPARECWR